MATSFNGWGTSWGNSWGTVDVNPNDMVGSASFAFSAAGTLTSESQFADTHDGYFHKQWAKLHKKPELADAVELAQEMPATALAEVKEAVKREYPTVDYSQVANNVELQLFIANQLLISLELRRLADEEDIEMLLLL